MISMRIKNGFTLIELLTVIIILAIIALISTPIFNTIIDNSKKTSFGSTVQNIMDAVDWYLLDEYDGKFTGYKTFSLGPTGLYEEGIDLPIEYDIKVKGTGTIVVNSQNQYFVSYSDTDYCASKQFLDEKVTITKGVCSGVVIPSN